MIKFLNDFLQIHFFFRILVTEFQRFNEIYFLLLFIFVLNLFTAVNWLKVLHYHWIIFKSLIHQIISILLLFHLKSIYVIQEWTERIIVNESWFDRKTCDIKNIKVREKKYTGVIQTAIGTIHFVFHKNRYTFRYFKCHLPPKRRP